MTDISATQAFAMQNLKMQEIDFLLSFGWADAGKGWWKPPFGYLKHKGVEEGGEQLYDKSHAVNSQKWVLKNR